ncbi:hypothetical protein ROZALSC1DRAFT_26853 [Rozella allomycis CSF55]|uniref:DNA-directed RNA polymerase III subunit RPC9 n=1 Tax=Rozella allomycis (strain CSF55) TaxID=988480 RepID=A0A075ATE0_ROZAC|nr:hypothetical protein O9G_001287 [Rozella allomycis CSF55]RKP21747.1 hypothetical protein ROZALSC1DRAFT_26853 [Rozella allomycis CSF55]|eukprot:EPZ33536.1 hypothetical protein O9G_001287 [Rozella allomycis CSF55]
MKILHDRVVFLSDAEVYDHLKYVSKTKCSVVYETQMFFEKCNIEVTRLSKEKILRINETLKAFNLTPAEKLQIFNMLPTSMVELICIIEECEERFQPNDLQEIIDAITEVKNVE